MSYFAWTPAVEVETRNKTMEEFENTKLMQNHPKVTERIA